MMYEHDVDVVIVGGGIAGLATAVGLYNAGIRNILVLEKAQSLRPVGAAIGLFPNGLRALKEVSAVVHQRVLDSSILSVTSLMYDLSDTLIKETDLSGQGPASSQITYLVWYLLQQYLSAELHSAEHSILRLGATVQSFNQDSSGVTVQVLDRGSGESTVKCRMLVGADGIWSTVRAGMFTNGTAAVPGDSESSVEPLFHGKMMFRSVLPVDALDAGVCPPAGTSNAWSGDEEGKLFAFRETSPGLATVTAMAKFAKADTRDDPEDRRKRLKELFSEYPAKVHHILDRMDSKCIFEHAVYDIDVLSRWSEGCVVLIGDAAHAMTPGLGQGANQGLEDACELVHHVRSILAGKPAEAAGGAGSDDLASCLEGFWRGRRERVVEVHGRSRERTAQVNRSTVQSRTNSVTSPMGADFSARVYGWNPSAVAARVERDSVAGATADRALEPALA